MGCNILVGLMVILAVAVFYLAAPVIVADQIDAWRQYRAWKKGK